MFSTETGKKVKMFPERSPPAASKIYIDWGSAWHVSLKVVSFSVKQKEIEVFVEFRWRRYEKYVDFYFNFRGKLHFLTTFVGRRSNTSETAAYLTPASEEWNGACMEIYYKY